MSDTDQNQDTDDSVANTSGLPKEIQAMQDHAMKTADFVERLRAFTTLISAANGLATRIKRITRDHEKNLKKVEAELEFLARHKAKEDMAFRALRGTYSAPEKALETFNGLCRTYSPDYVMEVVRLGSSRIGAVVGMNLLGMRMAGRDEADVNFERAVVPALANIAEDQRGYLDLKDTNLETEHDEVLKFVSTITHQRLALEAAVREYERERKESAISMQPDDIKRLDVDGFNLRLSLLPQKQRDAGIASLKEE
jgi:hypothetical protein